MNPLSDTQQGIDTYPGLVSVVASCAQATS
jgi:hypothetical protein